MGSPTESNSPLVRVLPMENNNKKSIKTFFRSIFHKKKERPNNLGQQQMQIEQKPKTQTDTVAVILENFNKLNLKEKKIEQNGEDDELENFSFKVIDEHRNERIHSHSSEDSGFSDKSENSDKLDKCDDLAEDLEKLELDDEEGKKKKKLQTVLVSRGPIKTKICDYNSGCPYPVREHDPYRQISQINKHTLTGGQVIVNQCQVQDNLTEIDIACETLQQKSQYLQNDRENYLEDVMAVIHEDTAIPSQSIPQYDIRKPQLSNQNVNFDINVRKPSPELSNRSITSDVRKSTPIMTDKKMAGFYDSESNSTDYTIADIEKTTIGQEEILQILHENNYETLEKEVFNYIQEEMNKSNESSYITAAYTYPTPPRSVPSPMSASPGSFYPSNSEYTLSPERSPIYNSDYEKYQEIPHFEEEKESATDKKARERTASISSMTMKQFKDLQKEILYNFSKKECCQLNRKSCKELFQEHMQKLKITERKDLCMKVAQMDLKTAYGVLHHILLSLSRGTDLEDLQFALFSLICERVLAEDITIFTGDSGLSLLKAACLRCPHKPLLTRYLVQCIRTAIKTNPSLAAGKDYIFHEVDALGDTLVIACARAGDRCADVLSELVRSHPNQPPLFKLHHNNADGYTALHVACSQHSAASSRMHTVHVLLEHAGFELTEGDLKGKDTALHLAVNSANCDLQLILLMFKQVDRKEWKNLAHWPNLSTKTPIDLARLATKSSSRQNYPPEVLDFLKKCR